MSYSHRRKKENGVIYEGSRAAYTASCSITLKNHLCTSITLHKLNMSLLYITISLRSNLPRGECVMLEQIPKVRLSGYNVKHLSPKLLSHIGCVNEVKTKSLRVNTALYDLYQQKISSRMERCTLRVTTLAYCTTQRL